MILYRKRGAEWMGRKKATNLFPDYIRTGDVDSEVLSQLVLRAKGSRSMTAFATDCEVNTSTISRIVNMKTTTACSDEVLMAISKAADPTSGVTIDQLLAANGMVKMVSAGIEGDFFTPRHIVFSISENVDEHGEDSGTSGAFMRSVVRYLSESKMEALYRETMQNTLLLNGFFVELIPNEKMSWPKDKQYRADFAIKTNALQDEGISTWLFECKSYTAGIGRGTIAQMNRMFAMAYLESPRELGIKISVLVNHAAMLQQARDFYEGYKIKDYFSFILIDPHERRVIDEFCIPRIDGTEKSVLTLGGR